METTLEAKSFSQTVKQQRIIRYISDTHMALQHQGLTKIAKKFNLEPTALQPGEYIVFMNSAQNAFKLMAPNNVIAYYRHPKNHKIDPRVISLIPKVFSGREIDMDQALKTVIERDFRSA